MRMDILISVGIAVVVISAALRTYIPKDAPVRMVGIDLGTTYSCVATYTGVEGVKVLSNEDGSRLTASVVAFDFDGEGKLSHVVGSKARGPAADGIKRYTVFDAKRFIGRTYDDVKDSPSLALYPFRVVANDSRPVFDLDGRLVSPEEIGSHVIAKLLRAAETAVGKGVTKAVMAVPVEFDEEQRNATMRAAELAGITVERILYEPTAAAMAYGLHSKPNVKYVVVYDLGGGTLDVSVLEVESGVFEVIATSGDNYMGGEDFNHYIMNHYLRRAGGDQWKELRASLPRSSLDQLRAEAERVKIALSDDSTPTVSVSLPALGSHAATTEKLTRAEFDVICDELFKRAMVPVNEVLSDIGLTARRVDEVVLVGGSTRLLRIREDLRTMFGGAKVNHDVAPEEAVAIGAAVQAGIITDSSKVVVAAVEGRAGDRELRLRKEGRGISREL